MQYNNYNQHLRFVKIKFPLILENIRELGKKNPQEKENILKIFSLSQWDKLPDNTKREHSLYGFKGYFKNNCLKSGLAKPPVNSRKFMAKAEKSGLYKERILEERTNLH